MRRCAAVLRGGRLGAAMAAWRSDAQLCRARAAQAGPLERAARALLQTHLARAWRSWAATTAATRHALSLLEHAVGTLKHGAQGRVWHTWAAYAAEAREAERLRRLMEQASRTLLHLGELQEEV